MEKRKLQRILGILMVVTFIIALVPLLFSSKQDNAPSQEVTALTAPDQQSSPAAAPEASRNTTAQNNKDSSVASPASMADANNSPTQTAQDNGITPIESNTQNAVPAAPVNSIDANNNASPSPAQINPADNTINTASSPAKASPADTSLSSAQQTNPDAHNTSAVIPANAASSTTHNTHESPSVPDSHLNVKYNTNNTVEVTPTPAYPDQGSALPQNTKATVPAVLDTSNTTTAPSQTKVEQTTAITVPTTKAVNPHHAHTSLIAKKGHHFSEENLANLKKPAWVVQMGSFKEKSNAYRLADQLRTAGFKAFTHEVASSAGIVRTRVYVGPEFKEASALKLSAKIKQEIKLRGFVVPYKPLAL